MTDGFIKFYRLIMIDYYQWSTKLHENYSLSVVLPVTFLEFLYQCGPIVDADAEMPTAGEPEEPMLPLLSWIDTGDEPADPKTWHGS